MKFNEDSRVKIPALLHLTRLGYRYLSLNHATWDASSNIFSAVFKDSLQKINPLATPDEIERTLQETTLLLDNEDLGKAFYERLLSTSGVKLIDFENFDANTFNVVTELPCIKDDEEFRPDITLLINGLPLAFIEVKKPNNRDGILAERNRIATRFRNPKFRRFVNITQLMMFSNNMEYDDSSSEPLQGAFYATTSYDNPSFNYFREENPSSLPVLPPLDADTENLILADNNLHALKHAPEYATMLDYIVTDFEAARLMHGDSGIGAMVICDSSAQAKKMAELFDAKYAGNQPLPPSVVSFATTAEESLALAAEDPAPYKTPKKKTIAVKTAALILHDIGTKESRKKQVEDFKEGKIDLLFVYNMLLTGFDSPRLKKLYLGRLIKAHNLLQALI